MIYIQISHYDGGARYQTQSSITRKKDAPIEARVMRYSLLSLLPPV